ncbi:MAG TPA: DUF1552 domain-containing protein [Polyangiales bacterium]|nr:DUF1552 domain-containing protein [Polyangiales bacterium]
MSALSRRTLLKLGLAGSAAALFPWLHTRRARAAGERVPKLLLFYTPHGTVWDQWRPSGGERDFTFSPILEPLAAHRDQLTIVDGIEIVSGTDYYIPHTYTMPELWTGSPIDTSASGFCREDHGGRCFGWNTGPSVDQTIAGRLGGSLPYPTIELGYACGGLHPATRMIYSAPGMPKSPIDDPTRAFNTLFGAVNPDVQAAARDALRRRSVLDAVRADLSSHRARLSTSDRARLDAHATALDELERALVPSEVVCTEPGAPTGVSSETAIDRQSDLAVAALGCGLTRIVSVQTRIADNDNSLYPWVGLDTGGHHTLSHDSGAASQATLAKVYAWYSARFKHLLDKLAATPDSDGRSLLENTFVIWGSELGTGWNHDIKNVPFVFAGGAAGAHTGGRYLKVTGTRWNRVLVSALHAMGITDVEKYGSLDNAEGPLSGLLTTP